MTDPNPLNQANDMNELLAQAARVQAELQKAQEEILAAQVTGDAGNGKVKVTMTGGAELLDVVIDPEVVNPDDIETLQDLIVGAFKDAHTKAGQLAQEKIGPLSQGMGQSQQGYDGPSFQDVFGGGQQ